MYRFVGWLGVFFLAAGVAVPELRTEWYVVPAAAAAAFAVLTMHPKLVRRLHVRPVYYDQLEDQRWENECVRTRYQAMFTRILQVSDALAVGGVAWYAFYAIKHPMRNAFEVFGVAGGLFSLYNRAHRLAGGWVLGCLHRKLEAQAPPAAGV